MFGSIFLIILFSVFVYLCYTSHKFVFFLKYSYYVGSGFITSFIIIPFLTLRPKDVRNLGAVAAIWTIMWKPLQVWTELRNGKNLEFNGPCVAVSNHQDALDILVMLANLPSRCTVLAKKELLYMGAFGPGAWLCGLVFIDRLNREKAKSTMVETINTVKDKNLKLWIFPEGTRNTKPTMLPFKKGAFHLAVQAQIPIVPIVISSYRHFLSTKFKYWLKGKILMTALDPIPTKGLTEDDVEKLTEEVQEKMQKILETSTKEVEDWAREQGNPELLNLLEKSS